MEIDIRTSVLLVVDVQNDFCEVGYAFHRSGRDLAPIRTMIHERLVPFLAIARSAGLRIVFVAAHYPRNKFSADGFSELCLEGTPGAEFYTIQPMLESGAERVFLKSEYDAFSNPELPRLLQEWRVDRVLLSGLTTPSCIRASAGGAVRMGCGVVLLSDLVAAAAHRMLQHEEVLELFRRHDKIEVVTSHEVHLK